MDTALVYLRSWHVHANRRRLLVLAVDQLRTYVHICNTLLSDAKSTETPSNELCGALQVLCWQWNTSAMLLCSRSAASLNAVKKQGGDLISCTISRLRFGLDADLHQVAAQTRQLCILISHAACQKNSLKGAFDSYQSKGLFLVFLLRGLEVSLKIQEDCNLALLITSLLRSLLLDDVHGGSMTLIESMADCQAFLLPLVRILQIDGGERPRVRSLEIFVVDFILRRNLTIFTVTQKMQELEPRSLLVRSMLALTNMYQRYIA